MGAFRKSARTSFRDQGSSSVSTIQVMEQKVVKVDGVETTVISCVKKDVQKYAKKLGLPVSENYQLKDMLKSGHLPEAVPVSGMLDNPDPTALENVGKDTDMFNKLVSMTPEPAPEPAPEPEPSNAE